MIRGLLLLVVLASVALTGEGAEPSASSTAEAALGGVDLQALPAGIQGFRGESSAGWTGRPRPAPRSPFSSPRAGDPAEAFRRLVAARVSAARSVRASEREHATPAAFLRAGLVSSPRTGPPALHVV